MTINLCLSFVSQIYETKPVKNKNQKILYFAKKLLVLYYFDPVLSYSF